MLDYTESPFWSFDEEARDNFGYNINLEKLDLSENTKIRLNSIIKLYAQRLNPVYQMFPSFWSGRMNSFFQILLKQVYIEIENELHDKYELINNEYELMNNEIDIEKIDNKLQAFLNNPSKYADEKGITYKTKESLNQRIQIAYKEWEKIESQWTTA